MAVSMQPEAFQQLFGVSRETHQKLTIYQELVVKWQKAINLVGPNTLGDLWGRHFADSAQLSRYVDENAVLADLGSGAGFPGLVLAIMRPDLKVNLIESDGRKAEFLRSVSRETDTPILIHNARIEDVLSGIEPDFITARAFASVLKILELSYKNSPAARLVLLKGKDHAAEVAEARSAFEFFSEAVPSQTDRQAQVLFIRDVKQKI